MQSLLPLMPAEVLESSTSNSSAESTSTENASITNSYGISEQTSTTPPQPIALDAQTQQTILSHAQAAVKQHIALLHAYNGIRDVGQGLMGMIAEQRGVRIKQVMEEMGVGEGD